MRPSCEFHDMGRWPDNTRANVTTAILIFVVLPLLCALAVWFVRG